MDLSTHCLSALLHSSVFGVWLGLVSRWDPLAHPVLYPRALLRDASPKAISERTSYLQVRLAYHPYPHVIP